MRKFVAQHRQNPFFRLLARQSYNYLRRFENRDYKFERNGEHWLLKKCASFNFKIIFDVGCNIGNWTTIAKKEIPSAEFHSFEINKPVFDQAKERLSKYPDIHLNNFGLSDQNTKQTAFIHSQNSGRTTIIPPEFKNSLDASYQTTFEAELKSGDTYVTQKQIKNIDFLKIDTEGNDPFVLKGLKETLKAEKIKLIQFEYGMANIKTKFLLHDFYELLEHYAIGKLYPKGVAFKEYEFQDENFWGPNYVAVHKDYQNIIDALYEKPIKLF